MGSIQDETQRCIPIGAQTIDEGSGRTILQVSKELSKMNHRLYRRARDYTVRFDPILNVFDHNSHYTFDFFTLPNTWFVKGAIKHAYNTYMQSHRDELEAGVKFSRWHDFSINEQNPDGTWDYMKSMTHDGNGWEGIAIDEDTSDSSVTNAAGTVVGFHLIGNLANSYNIFREFANLLNYKPDSPTVTSVQPYDGLLGLDDADRMAEVGDNPPYDRDFSNWLPADTTVDDDQSHNILTYAGSLVVDVDGGIVRGTPWMTAPLGLVYIIPKKDESEFDLNTTLPHLCLHVKAGKYKGVDSRSLTA